MINRAVIDRESKLKATDRLRREGRWEEASEFREKQRLRLRSEGMSKGKAVEEAWRLMLENFPDFDVRLSAARLAMAEESPTCFTDDSRMHCIVLWRAYCRVMATYHEHDNGLMTGDRFHIMNCHTDRLLAKLPTVLTNRGRVGDDWDRQHEPSFTAAEEAALTASTNSMLTWVYTSDGQGFLDLLELTFNDQICRIPDDSPYELHVKHELKEIVDQIPKARVQFAKHWPPTWARNSPILRHVTNAELLRMAYECPSA